MVKRFEVTEEEINQRLAEERRKYQNQSKPMKANAWVEGDAWFKEEIKKIFADVDDEADKRRRCEYELRRKKCYDEMKQFYVLGIESLPINTIDTNDVESWLEVLYDSSTKQASCVNYLECFENKIALSDNVVKCGCISRNDITAEEIKDKIRLKYKYELETANGL